MTYSALDVKIRLDDDTVRHKQLWFHFAEQVERRETGDEA